MTALPDWRRPFLTAYSDGDPPTRGWDKVFAAEAPTDVWRRPAGALT